jgi:hypothetical protein
MDWIFSSEQMMNNSPSRVDGISFELEKGYRSKTAWFIEELGKELKLLVKLFKTNVYSILEK